MKKSLLEQMRAHLQQISDADFAAKWTACADAEMEGPSLAEYLNLPLSCDVTVSCEEPGSYKIAAPLDDDFWVRMPSSTNTNSGSARVFFGLISPYGNGCTTGSFCTGWL